MFSKMLQHKFLTTIILLLLATGGYFGYTKFFSANDVVRYVTARVQKGAIIVSISGSGQVSASNQTDIKPKVSGDIVLVAIKNNQEVKAGTLIAQLDAKDAQKTARDAETNLESAKLSLAKLKKSADALSIIQAENTLTQAEDNLTKLKLSQKIEYQKVLESKQNAKDDLEKAYEDGFNVIANAFLDLPNIMSGLDDILFDSTFENNQSNIDWYSNQTSSQNGERDKALIYRDDVYDAYNKARDAYTKNFDNYKLASRTSNERLIYDYYRGKTECITCPEFRDKIAEQ